MAEFILSKCLDVLFDRLLSSDLLKFARQEGIREELDKWKKTLERIQKMLDDAEEKQYTETSVKDWLDHLKDFAYDVEDFLDEFATEALDEHNLMAGESQASASMIVQKTDASSCNFRLLSEKWMCKDPKLRPTFAEIMAALKLLEKPIPILKFPGQAHSQAMAVKSLCHYKLQKKQARRANYTIILSVIGLQTYGVKF